MNYRSGEAPDHLRRSAIARATLRWVERNVVPSRFLQDVFAGFGIASEIIPNIVDVDRFALPDAGLRCGRTPLDAELRDALQRRVHAARVPARPGAISRSDADAGRRRDRRKRRCARSPAELGLANVRFVGRVPPAEIWRYYADADIYLQTPNIDNMPSSVLEAFASGCAVVSTNAGGVPAILTDDEHGLLVNCNDHDAAAARILRLLDDPPWPSA